MTKRKPKEEHKKNGRPTDYKEKYCNQIVDFFSKEEPFDTNEVTAFGNTYKKRWANTIPTFEKFARSIGVCADTLIEWCKNHPDFSEAYNICKDIQKEFVFTNGMLGLYNSDFTKFFAKNCLGMKDKVEQELTGEPLVKKIYITPEQQKAVEEHVKSVISGGEIQ